MSGNAFTGCLNYPLAPISDIRILSRTEYKQVSGILNESDVSIQAMRDWLPQSTGENGLHLHQELGRSAVSQTISLSATQVAKV